jgi:spore maturation protein SpmA
MVNLVGVALGPLITGMVSDRLGGANAVGLALAATVSVNLIAALCFWMGMRRLDSASIFKLEAEAAAKVAPAAL